MKSILYRIIFLLITLFSFSGCSKLDNNQADIDAVKQLTSIDYMSAVNNQDTAAYKNLFADDVFWAPPNGPVCRSTDDIANSLQQNFDKFSFHLESTTPAEIQVFGNYAYSLSEALVTLKPKDGSPEISMAARVIWILKKQSDGWKISRQIYNFAKPN